MQEIPTWKQYGFESEAAFRERYPNAGRVVPKAKPKAQQNRNRKLMTKAEQQRMDRYNEVNRGVN